MVRTTGLATQVTLNKSQLADSLLAQKIYKNLFAFCASRRLKPPGNPQLACSLYWSLLCEEVAGIAPAAGGLKGQVAHHLAFPLPLSDVTYLHDTITQLPLPLSFGKAHDLQFHTALLSFRNLLSWTTRNSASPTLRHAQYALSCAVRSMRLPLIVG